MDNSNLVDPEKTLKTLEKLAQTLNNLNDFSKTKDEWRRQTYIYGLTRAEIHQLREDYFEIYITPDYQQLCQKKLYPPRHNATIHYTLIDKTPLGQDKPLILVTHACLQETYTALLQEYQKWKQVYDPQGTPQQYIQHLRQTWLNNNTLAPITPAKAKHIQKLAPRLHKAITAGIQAAQQATTPNTALWTWNTLEPICIYTVIDTTNLTPDQAANKTSTRRHTENTTNTSKTLQNTPTKPLPNQKTHNRTLDNSTMVTN